MITFVRNVIVFMTVFVVGFVAGRIQPKECKAYLEDGRRLMSYRYADFDVTCKYIHPRSMEPAKIVRAK